ALSVATAFRGRLWLVPAFTLVLAVALTAQASRVNLRSTASIRSDYPGSLTWVDEAAHGRVTAVATPNSPASDLLSELWWNQSVQREAVLDGAAPTDAFATTKIDPSHDGRLRGVGGELLVDDYGTTTVFANARRIAHSGNFTLWNAGATARLRALVEGRYYDAWLSDKGSIRTWPRHAGSAVATTFRLSLPPDWSKTATLKLGRGRVVLQPGSAVQVTCTSTGGPLHLNFSSQSVVLSYSGFFRRLAVQLTRLHTRDVAGAAARGGCMVAPVRAGAAASAGASA